MKKILFLIFIFNSKIFSFVDYPYGVNFQIVRQPLLPLDNFKLNQGEIATRVSFRQMNVWSRQSNYYIIDGEESQAEATLRYAIKNYWTMSGSFSYLSQGGGIFDSSIQRFHSMAGVTQGGRDDYPKNKVNVSYEPYGAYYGIIDNNPLKTILRQYDSRNYPREENDSPITLDEITRSGFRNYILFQKPELNFTDKTEIIALRSMDRHGNGNPRLFTEFDLNSGKYLDKLKIGFQYKFPIPNSFLLASPGFDRSIFIVAGKNITEKVFLKFGVSYTNFGEIYHLNFKLPKTRYVFRSSLEYSILQKSILFFEYVASESPFRNFGRLGKPSHQISFGYKYNFEKGQFTMGVAEDIINFSTSPDIGFFTSFESKF